MASTEDIPDRLARVREVLIEQRELVKGLEAHSAVTWPKNAIAEVIERFDTLLAWIEDAERDHRYRLCPETLSDEDREYFELFGDVGVQCLAITKKGTQCRGTSYDGQFCARHDGEFPKPVGLPEDLQPKG